MLPSKAQTVPGGESTAIWGTSWLLCLSTPPHLLQSPTPLYPEGEP